MIPFFSRSAAVLSCLAACLFATAVVLPSAAEAQNVSTQMRAASRAPAKQTIHAPAPWVPNPGVAARDSYLIVDAASGRDLVNDRADEPRHPASLTKMMTLYMAFAALDGGRLALGDVMPVSLAAANTSPTKMGAPLGGTLTVRDAVMGLVTRSANDAAVVLAEAMAGDEDSFAKQMTQKAKQLGMLATLFRNASGLPNREQVTTARDMSRLAHALLRDFPHYYALFSVQTYVYRGRPLENHNRMLATYAGADGFKTGYTAASGYNLVMSATRDGRRLIGVVMGGDTAFGRDRLMAQLMDMSFVSAPQAGVAGWSPARTPPGARYTAANFVPGAALPEPAPLAATPPRATTPQTTTPAAAPAVASLVPPAPAAAAAVVPAAATTAATPLDTLPIGSWVIQVGSFGDSRAAQAALERATSLLPNLRSRLAVSVDEVQMAQKTFHRARLTNLSQEDATDGCKRLEQKKIYCSALQVTAWNTPGAR